MNFPIATLEKLQNFDKETPCIFDGVEFKPQIPKDNECEFEYIRTIDEKIENKDTGGCYSMPNKRRTIRYVYFSSSLVNPEAKFKEFWNQVKNIKQLEITGFSYDANKVAKAEGTEFKNLTAKNFTYIYVEFTYITNTDNCQPTC